MKYTYGGPDGYKSWEEFRKTNFDRDPPENHFREDTDLYKEHELIYGKACVINSHNYLSIG